MRRLMVAPGLVLAAVWGLAGPGPADGQQKGGKQMGVKVEQEDYGKTQDGTPVERWTLTNPDGIKVRVLTYGTIITELHVPDKDGKTADVVLGFDNLEGYLGKHPYFGCTVGRVCNRIAKGRFTLDGKEYKLAVNNGPNHLHGGIKGLDKAVWTARRQMHPDGAGVRFTYTSPDGDEGYPGTLSLQATYVLTVGNELIIDYFATSDKPTPVNLTNHSYFNLAGHDSGNVLDHVLEIFGRRYTPVDENLIPTGELKSVRGTPYDFLKPVRIGERIDQLKGDPGGYDINYVHGGNHKDFQMAARVWEPKSGRVMAVVTNTPGIQFYTANYLDGSIKGKGGVAYKKHQGLCLETQYYPDAVNQPKFPSIIIRPGQAYAQSTVFAFSIKK